MLYKFLVESYRNKVNRPLSFFVNWFGLTLGFAAVIVMYLYIIGEVRHDKGVYDRELTDVYRCEVEKSMGAICPAPLAEFVAQMPEVAASAKIMGLDGQTISTVGLANNNKFKFMVTVADSSLLKVLPFRMIAGSSADALSDEGKVIVNRSLAIKLFGTTDVIGRALEMNNKYPLQISGVIEDIPENSTWSPQAICNIKLLAKLWGYDDVSQLFARWNNWSYDTYLRLKPGVDPVAFEAKYSKAVKDRLTAEYESEFKDTPTLRAFDDLYFATDVTYGSSKSTDPNSLKILIMIAALILVIAIINYVNIYTARSTEVIRAMGIKAIMGGSRSRLIGFVIFDSVVITLLSAISGLIVAAALEPLYPAIIGSEVSFSMSWDTILILFVGLPLICGVLSGIFPALALTRMRPLDAIACRGGRGTKMAVVRNVLIVFQFTVTIGLIASTLFINKQMKYMSELDLGYSRDNIYVVSGGTFMPEKFKAFRSALVSNPNIQNATIMSMSPLNVGSMMTISWGETEAESATVKLMYNDENALATLGVKVLEGDSIAPDYKNTTGSRQFMINETFAKKMREQDPTITFPYKRFIGVFSDFQFLDLTQNIEPLAILAIGENEGSAYIRIAAGSDLQGTLKFIEKSFSEFYPDEIFEGYFLDEMFNTMYKNEQLFRSRLMTFSILAVFIGCLGLYALVGYSVQRRRREIAIRKVYGSTVGEALVLLSVGFLKWLIISFIIAVPLVWMLMDEWVTRFAYRTDISWWIFAIAGAVALLVAIITVLGQTYHAATENPANAMKD